MSDGQRFVIVGASLAGASAAEALRENGFEGAIVLIGEERHRPYERASLSKGYLLGSEPAEKAYDPTAREFCAFWLKEGGVIAGVNVNVRDVHADIRDILADPSTSLADLVQ
jgi:NADPH-dependent 2,4-dienoyl-CoA reductase/sulfur reductase-like enzyme